MGVDLNTWAKALSDRLTEKTKHVYDMVDQKLEYQHKYLEQRLDNVHNVQSERLLNFSVRLEEALAEIRGYKDILQQQLTVVDSATKRAHERIDELSEKSKEGDVAIEKAFDKLDSYLRQQTEENLKRLIATEETVKNIQKSISAIEQTELIETTQKQALKEDPIRKFMGDNASKLLVIILSGVGIYILRNLGNIIQSIFP